MASELDQLSPEELELLLQQKQGEREAKGPQDLNDLTDEELETLFKMKAEEKVSGSESALRGAAQGITLGFADEISGAVESAFTDKTYEQARDESRDNFELAKAANPTAFLAGEVAGGVGAAVVSGGAGAGLRGAAAAGTIAGIGQSEEDQIEAQLLDGLMGTGLGVAGYGIGKSISWGGTKLKKSLVNALDSEADSLGMKALGIFHQSGRKKMAKKLQMKNMSPREFLDAFENEVDVAGKPLIKVTGTQEELLEDLIERKSQIGEEMGSVLKSIDVKLQGPAIKPGELADRLQEEVIDPLLSNPAATDDMLTLAAQVQRRVDILKDKKADWTMMDLHNWKVNTQSKVNFLKKQNSDLELNAQLRKIVTSTNDFIHDKVEVLSDDPQALSIFKDMKKRFGILADAEEFVEDAVQAEADGILGKVRKALGLAHVGGGATIAGGIAGGVPGAAIGAALTVASKSPKINLAMSKTLRKVGLALTKNPGNTEYMTILMGAAARGSDAFNAALDLVEKKVDGFITSPEEAEQYRVQVLNSGLTSREQMNLMNQINNGRIPQIQAAQQNQPFFREFTPRSRDEDGRKI